MKNLKQIKNRIASVAFSIMAVTGVCFAVPTVMDAISECKYAAELASAEEIRQLEIQLKNDIATCSQEWFQAIRNIQPMPHPCHANLGDYELWICLGDFLPKQGPSREQFERFLVIQRECIGRAGVRWGQAKRNAEEKLRDALLACERLPVNAPITEN